MFCLEDIESQKLDISFAGRKIFSKKPTIALVAMLFAKSATADWDKYFVATTYGGATSVVITLSPFLFATESVKAVRKEFSAKMKMAGDDAASYIASSGEVRGPYLESALAELRRDNQYSFFDEPQLVQAILDYSVN